MPDVGDVEPPRPISDPAVARRPVIEVAKCEPVGATVIGRQGLQRLGMRRSGPHQQRLVRDPPLRQPRQLDPLENAGELRNHVQCGIVDERHDPGAGRRNPLQRLRVGEGVLHLLRGQLDSHPFAQVRARQHRSGGRVRVHHQEVHLAQPRRLQKLLLAVQLGLLRNHAHRPREPVEAGPSTILLGEPVPRRGVAEGGDVLEVRAGQRPRRPLGLGKIRLPFRLCLLNQRSGRQHGHVDHPVVHPMQHVAVGALRVREPQPRLRLPLGKQLLPHPIRRGLAGPGLVDHHAHRIGSDGCGNPRRRRPAHNTTPRSLGRDGLPKRSCSAQYHRFAEDALHPPETPQPHNP